MTRIHTLFEMEPIGVNGALESVTAYGFCSKDCRDAFWTEHKDHTLSPAEEPNSFEDGHVCDRCGKELQ